MLIVTAKTESFLIFTLNIIIYLLLLLPSNFQHISNYHVSVYYESVLHCGDYTGTYIYPYISKLTSSLVCCIHATTVAI